MTLPEFNYLRRKHGLGTQTIAKAAGLNIGTVRSWGRREIVRKGSSYLIGAAISKLIADPNRVRDCVRATRRSLSKREAVEAVEKIPPTYEDRRIYYDPEATRICVKCGLRRGQSLEEIAMEQQRPVEDIAKIAREVKREMSCKASRIDVVESNVKSSGTGTLPRRLERGLK